MPLAPLLRSRLHSPRRVPLALPFGFHRVPWSLGFCLAALIVMAIGHAEAAPAEAADLAALRAQVQALEQQLRVLSRQLEVKEEAAAAAAASPKVSITDKGYSLTSADGASAIQLRGHVQLDARTFFRDGTGLTNNAFVLRRARLSYEGVLAKRYGFQLVPEFGGGSVSVFDANLTASFSDAVQLRIGKFKVPVGLELLQADQWTTFNERSIATNLVPNRDLGIQLSGDLAAGRLSYAVGVFNGVADAANSTNSDFDNDKDAVMRLLASPFRNDASSAWQGLTFGVGASVGRQKTAAGRAAGYRTDGQQVFFSYNPGVVADGRSWRVSPQLDYRNGSLGFLAEYMRSSVTVRPASNAAARSLAHAAGQATAAYVLTGEASSVNGVIPTADFDPAAGTWGAFEIAGRVARLQLDDATFPAFASPTANAARVTSYGLGLNWYLSKAAMLKIDFYRDQFGQPAAAPAASLAPLLRQDENVLITRFQLGF